MTRRTALIIAIAVLVAAIVAVTIANRYRDSIALGVANRVLSGSDLVVTDVSVNSISAESVDFEQILVQLGGGSMLDVRGVSLPVTGFRRGRVHVDAVTLIPGETDPEAVELAVALQNYAEAGPRTHGVTIEVGELTLPDAPPIRDLAWYGDNLNPTVRLSIEGLEVYVTMTSESDSGYRGSMRAFANGGDEVLRASLGLSLADDSVMLHGTIHTRLEHVAPLLRFYGVIPAEVTSLSGTLSGPFDVRISRDATIPVPISVELEQRSPISVVYQQADGARYDIDAIELSSLVAGIDYPSLDWSASTAQGQLLVTGGGFERQPVSMKSLRCRRGIVCSADVSTSMHDLQLGGLSIGGLTMSATALEFVNRKEGWRAESAQAGLALRDLTYAGRRFVAPSVDAHIVATDVDVSSTLRIITPEGALSGRAEVRHDLATGDGAMQIDAISLDIDLLNFSEAFYDWPFEWDVTSGTWSISGALQWSAKDEGFAYTGLTTHTADGLAGKYGESGFVGMNSSFDLSFESGRSPSIAPMSLEIALLEVGFPVEDIAADLVPDLDALAVDVQSVTMSALGGAARLAPFRFDPAADSTDLYVTIEGIQLPLMVGLADLEAVNISGTVSGDVPVSMRDGKIVVTGGRLEADSPGGTIRYRGGAVGDGDTQLGIVTRTLQNFEFDALTSDVDYDEEGDLKLQMRLTGVNPDVDPDQPVILNLNVENNIPAMLRSLQATRSIEEILEQKLSK